MGSMVKYINGGGEANAVAIRITRPIQRKMLHFVDIMAGMIGIYQQI